MNKFAHTFIAYFDEILCSAILILMIGLVILNVLLRYFFNYSISWAEEVATICFVWCVFIGASATYKHKLDMGIDFFIIKAPEQTQKILRLLTGLILLTINGYIFFMAIVFTSIAWEKPTAVLGISAAIFNSALIVGFGLTTFYTFRFLIRDVTSILKSEKTL